MERKKFYKEGWWRHGVAEPGHGDTADRKRINNSRSLSFLTSCGCLSRNNTQEEAEARWLGDTFFKLLWEPGQACRRTERTFDGENGSHPAPVCEGAVVLSPEHETGNGVIPSDVDSN